MAGRIVWLASYPKSGNTWLRLLLTNLIFGKEDAADINDIELPGCAVPACHFFEESSLIDPCLLKSEEIDELRPKILEKYASEVKGDAYLKVHDAYRRLDGGEPLLGRGYAVIALYIMRDPRDVAISLAHHMGFSIDESINMLNSREGMIGGSRKRYDSQLSQLLQSWSRNVESWVDQKDLPVYVLRYEDLHEDTFTALRKASDFLGFDFSAEEIKHAVRFSDFSELQRQEKQRGFCEHYPKSTAPFFRTGRVGGWREILTEEQQGAIMQKHRRVMERFGYL